MSPPLFGILMFGTTRECIKNNNQRSLVGYWILIPIYMQTLLCAADIVLIADTVNKIEKLERKYGKERNRTV